METQGILLKSDCIHKKHSLFGVPFVCRRINWAVWCRRFVVLTCLFHITHSQSNDGFTECWEVLRSYHLSKNQWTTLPDCATRRLKGRFILHAAEVCRGMMVQTISSVNFLGKYVTVKYCIRFLTDLKYSWPFALQTSVASLNGVEL